MKGAVRTHEPFRGLKGKIRLSPEDQSPVKIAKPDFFRSFGHNKAVDNPPTIVIAEDH